MDREVFICKVVHGAMACGQKSFKLVWRCHQLLSGWAQISFHLPYSWGKPRKTSARRPSDEWAVRPVIASNVVAYLQMRSEGLHSKSGWVKEGKYFMTCWPWSHGLRTKNLLVWRCLHLLSGFLAKGHLPRVSRQSRPSLMIRTLSWSLQNA